MTEPMAAALPPLPTDPTATSARRTPPAPGGGVKETVESILVAFILAFVFRAFVVEAFVIPTGSMATTLLGAHTRFQCPDCGYAFDLNYSPPGHGGEDDDLAVPSNAGPIGVKLYCPNCGFLMPPDQVANPAVAYGDRILVLKYLYLLSDPKRWDVVVFKAPMNPDQNYIKRLIGRPGEGVLVLDGDVYIRPAGDPDPKHFVIQSKPPAVQDAMWRLVYDNDYHPQVEYGPDGKPHPRVDRDPYPWQQPWRVSYGTCRQDDPVTHGRTFTFDAGAADCKVVYDPTLNASGQGTSDYLVYDQNAGLGSRQPRPGWTDGNDTAVSDVDVRLTYQRSAGSGPFSVVATKREDTFTAELTPTAATLYHEVDGRRHAVASPYPLRAGSRPVRVELSNADYHVVLRVDGAVVAQTSPSDYAPKFDALLREFNDRKPPPPPTVTLQARGHQAVVTHLSLWRDVYYTNRRSRMGPRTAIPDDFPENVQQLGPDEYFTMGDNSQLSYDARCWPTGIHLPAEGLDVGPGRVPGRFLLGKAFYVYWPAGYRAANWLPSLVPNFSGMRLIH